MWKVLLVLALPLAPLVAAHGGTPDNAITAGSRGDVQCQIRATPWSGGVELEGIVASQTPLSGTYRFEVRKVGHAGTSSSVQSGEFDAGTDEEVVGHVGLGLERGASYDARLVLEWTGGEASCAAVGPDRA